MGAFLVREGNSIDYIPNADTEAGTIVVQGGLVGVVNHKIFAGDLGSVEISGVYEIDKDSKTDTFTVGAPVWLNADGEAVTTDASKGFFGYAVKASANTDTTVTAKIVQCGAGGGASDGGSSSSDS